MCGEECTTGVPRGNLGFSLCDSSLGEVHQVMTRVSDAPGSLFGELEKITRDSRAPLILGACFFFFKKKMESLSLLSLHLAHQRFTMCCSFSSSSLHHSWWFMLPTVY